MTPQAAKGFVCRHMNDLMSSQQNNRVKFPSTLFTVECFTFLLTAHPHTSAFWHTQASRCFCIILSHRGIFCILQSWAADVRSIVVLQHHKLRMVAVFWTIRWLFCPNDCRLLCFSGLFKTEKENNLGQHERNVLLWYTLILKCFDLVKYFGIFCSEGFGILFHFYYLNAFFY